MEYRALAVDGLEIRIITILTEKEDPQHATGPVHCRLDHVSIDHKCYSETHMNGHPTIGSNKIWPSEVVEDIEFEPKPRANADSNILWRERYAEVSSSQEGSLNSQSLRIADQGDGHLPWRYEWGDYVALSYVWGDARTKREIFVNGISMQVTPNLEAALRQLRDCYRIKQGFKVWADAICINQADIVERSEQVGKMKAIYASAWHVVVFLGVEADDSDMAMVAVKYLSLRWRSPEPLEAFYHQTRSINMRPLFVLWSTFKSPMRQNVYRALYHFFNRPYWQRLWILQEIANGRQDTPVLCGKRTVHWQEIYEAASFIQLDEHRFGRDIMASVGPKTIAAFSWDFTSDRLYPEDGSDASSERLWKLTLSIMAVQKAQHNRERDDTSSAFQCLLLSRDAQATDQKDKVYGILGLSSIARLVEITPDYTLSVEQTFCSFSRLLCASGDLRYLRLVDRPIAEMDEVYNWLQELSSPFTKRPLLVRKRSPVLTACKCGLPSWVVCWRCPHSRTAHLLGRYAAAGQTRGNAVFSSSGKLLRTRGILFDTINSLSAFHRLESDHTYPSNGKSIQSVYGDSSATKAAFWRTIVGDTTREGDWAPSTYSCLLNPLLWVGGIAGVQTNFMGLNEFMARNKNLQLFEYNFKQLIGRGMLTRRLYNPSQLEIDASSWAMNVLAWRRLITTDGGYLGLAPAATLPHDKICILPGCNVPLVLRPRGEHFEIIGECYIHGIMRGEALQGVEEGKHRLEDIAIC